MKHMKKVAHAGLRTWIEIDTRAIRANYQAFRKFIPKNVRMCGVVKSNAYGHNLTEFALELEKLGIDMLAVDSIVEALSLRKAKVKTPILVLGYTLPEMFKEAVGKNIHLTISSIDGLKKFLKSPVAHKVPIHIKVDTGMHRQGFLSNEQEVLLKLLGANPKLKVVGLYTHFAESKDPNNRAFTLGQIDLFSEWRDMFMTLGHDIVAHAGATGGTLVHPEAHFDMVRIGMSLYGVPAADTLNEFHEKRLPLRPVLSWKTIIAEIKEISAGRGVGYDRTHITAHPTRIAVCPIGYWHGYPRALSNVGEVLVNGKRAKVLGRVSMDMIVVDVTDIPRIKVGDEVVLIGHSKGDMIGARELAQGADTTPYEILTRLNPLMRRIYK